MFVYGGAIIIKNVEINEDIRDKEIRLIDSEGNQLGIVSGQEAQQMANEKNLDLVKISPNAKPPVCKIMDYGKFRYEEQKREKEQKKKQKIINVKEVRLSPNIENHDLEVKRTNALKFLQGGDKVKVTLRFKGREKEYTNHGYKVMEKFLDTIKDDCLVEKKPSFEGRSMIMILAPKS